MILGAIIFPAPTNVDLANNNLPIFSPGFLAGTDRLGRDNFALFCYGSLSTIALVVPARIFTIFVSFLLSAFSLFFPKRSDFVFQELFLYLSPSLLYCLPLL